MAREINLVPDVKGEMIKALKLRNFIFFICIVVASASLGVSLLFFSIAAGQKAALSSKKNSLDIMSGKIAEYSDLSDFLTIRDQLGNLSSISDNKLLLSRSFGALSAMLPTGADTITISSLTINFEDEVPIFTLEAQANAGKEPYIDYNVLDSFKKGMPYLRYDYGTYVDKDGNDIPAYCMIETGADGATLKDAEKGLYAYWLINGDGCAPERDDEDKDIPVTSGYTTEEFEGNTVVRIWRTPQYNEWYSENDDAKMTSDGVISGVAHFDSQCISYSYDDISKKWTESNDQCLLIPDGADGIVITESSNGRDASDELVLRFTATITLAPEAFSTNNHHMLSLGPSTRYNVTDSYMQVQHMFEKRASDCAIDDVTCNNANGGNN